jgi:hypothetical protein
MTDNITLPRATVVQALETQAASKEDMKVYRSIVDNYWKGLAAKAEQQAEPVADGDKVICPACCHQFRGIPETVQTLMLHAGFEPPFTTPPQRKELSASEILNMMPSTIPAEYDGELMEFARAVEAKLKERNGY